MESWLTRALRAKKTDRGTPGSPGGGEIGTPVFPDGQGSLFAPPPSKKSRRKHVYKKKQPPPPAGRSWNDVAQM